MPPAEGNYLAATRHPWSSLLFVLPLLAAYEVGVLFGAPDPERVRNGADLWLRDLLALAGLDPWYAAPALLLLLLLAWGWARRGDCPGELVTVWVGMAAESAAFAGGLWLLCQALVPALHHFHIYFQIPAARDPAVLDLLTFLGAGIYEEALFRLGLFAGLAWILSQTELPRWAAASQAALLSALVFALAHHLGTCGEPFEPYAFLFRTLAGLYFAVLFRLRGFGVAVGAHAGYDVLVGLLLD